MAERLRFPLGDRTVVHAAFTDRSDGDLAREVDPEVLRMRRSQVSPHPWTWLRQVHRATVLVVDEPGARAGEVGDAAVTTCARAVLSVQVADCAPVLMFAPTPQGAVLGAAHAGWRGLLGGVLGSTVEEMRGLGAERIEWLVGPCISAARYEFAERDLDRVAEALGPGVRSVTDSGSPALDIRAAVRGAMVAAGCGDPVVDTGACTTSPDHWSHRADGAPQRQVGAIWWEQ